ncbi:hypothetical protein ABLT15_36825 [Paraburkholderia tropica]|uniref:hypothetical protein n=1 Tax=Paraburkholderia tropica TaxID=92647 RepID=UPI0032B32C17
MADLRDASSQLLTQLLSVNSPELGARLKQRLNAAFAANGLGGFDEKSLGFAKFTDYLLRQHGDLVSVERREGFGDILVSLRSMPSARTSYIPVLKQLQGPATPVIRSDVWQAFANPDPERKRFFNVHTARIVHYLKGKSGPERAQVESAPDTFVEILPISGDVQARWMREFLGSASLPSNEREALEPLVAEPYSSAVNATFTRALGAHSVAWRNYRTAQITSVIDAWAHGHAIPLSQLHVVSPDATAGTLEAAGTTESRATATLAIGSEHSLQVPPRQQVVKLLELLTDDDIVRLVLPTLLSTIMIKSRL